MLVYEIVGIARCPTASLGHKVHPAIIVFHITPDYTVNRGSSQLLEYIAYINFHRMRTKRVLHRIYHQLFYLGIIHFQPRVVCCVRQ